MGRKGSSSEVAVSFDHPTSEAKHLASALDSVENTRVVYRYVLFGDNLDNLLRDHTSGYCGNVVEFSTRGS